ncbi:hypothetical protein [Streptomyces sp. NPDC005573]|uniref:hypothetical protein n=1 Tax=Streptomyces sp. NPDC005573 TaxID=3156890 RepID=UPI0033BA8207
MRARIGSTLGAIALTAASVIGISSPASADSTYSSDECTSSGNARCFTLFYNSQSGAIWASSCFIASGDISDYTGYYAGGGVQVYFVFAYRSLTTNAAGYCDNSSGDGLPVKNNAAAGSNTMTSSYRVYYNSNYGGASQTFSPGTIANLNSTLKNENASGQAL